MSDYLPLDAIRLIDIGARLSSRPLVEIGLEELRHQTISQ